MTPDTCGGRGAQTTHALGRGQPADGSRRSLEWSQRAAHERFPGLVMNPAEPPRPRLGFHLSKPRAGLGAAASGSPCPALSLARFALEEGAGIPPPS